VEVEAKPSPKGLRLGFNESNKATKGGRESNSLRIETFFSSME